EKPEVLTRLNERRSLWRWLRMLAVKGDYATLRTELKTLASRGKADPFGEAIARDFIETLQRNPSPEIKVKPTLSDAELADLPELATSSNKALLIEKADSRTRRILDEITFLQRHFRGPEWEPYKQAVAIDNPASRAAFLRKKLGSAKSTPSCRAFFNALITPKQR
ncbi:MAG: hypothetical protein AABZ06_14170, partial [Bdellovibrionota bacterium]